MLFWKVCRYERLDGLPEDAEEEEEDGLDCFWLDMLFVCVWEDDEFPMMLRSP